MGTTYTEAGHDVHEMIATVIQKHHDALKIHGVTFDVLFVEKYEGPEDNQEAVPAIKNNGYPAVAKISFSSHQDRVRGIADVKLVIDRNEWKQIAKTRQMAALDHELTHIEVARDNEGVVKKDDCGRPKLKMRVHDFEIGWFTEVAERWGEASPEVRAMVMFQENYGQYCFPFMKGTTKGGMELVSA